MTPEIAKQNAPVNSCAPAGGAAVLLFAATIFSGAFLLFGVQPLVGRFLLPWFGGTPEVWTTCMLFFQVFLLAGYAGAHVSIRYLSPRHQAVGQIALLAVAAATLSVIPPDSLKPSWSDNPVAKILIICTVCVGLPYFLLSTTGPLMQAWFARLTGGKAPWRFYALGNAGSLLALVCFPLVFEPHFTRAAMAKAWSAGFLIYAVLFALSAVLMWKNSRAVTPPERLALTESRTESPGRKTIFLWLALPACASVELLAVTTKITQDIAVIPFLWILPLCLYLLSFILCFDHPRWYVRPVFLSLFIAGIIGVIFARNMEKDIPAGLLVALYASMLFFCSMVCHGELYRLRPQAGYITTYYLAISAGGALGGIFVAVIAPLLFKVYHELHLGLLASAAIVLMAQEGLSAAAKKRRPLWISALVAVGLLGIFFQGRRSVSLQTAIDHCRNFFGVLTVWEETNQDPQMCKLLLQHGTTFHGFQFQDPAKKLLPTAYYSPHSGIGLYLQNMPAQDNRRIGIVGLGVGTIAIYGRPSDTIRFYEINPQVERMARQYFSYLTAGQSKIEIILGDARLSMENESPQQYDVLVLDAFSSDAIPIHLLTKEAFEIYMKHLAENGVIAFHISTLHLNLHSVIWKAADHFGLCRVWIENDDFPEIGALASDWILLSRNPATFDIPSIQKAASHPGKELVDMSLWTDDYINLVQILK